MLALLMGCGGPRPGEVYEADIVRDPTGSGFTGTDRQLVNPIAVHYSGCQDFCDKNNGPPVESCEGPVTIGPDGVARFSDGATSSGNVTMGSGSQAILCRDGSEQSGCGGGPGLFPGAMTDPSGIPAPQDATRP